MVEPKFLNLGDIIFIHDQEINISGGSAGIRDQKAIESAIGAAQATFAGKYLNDIFEMAATYLNSIIKNHPFVDGNKRTGLAAALTFLFINGIEIDEKYEEEFADQVLLLTENKISKEDMVDFFKERVV